MKQKSRSNYENQYPLRSAVASRVDPSETVFPERGDHHAPNKTIVQQPTSEQMTQDREGVGGQDPDDPDYGFPKQG
jgi:hypothetical protein